MQKLLSQARVVRDVCNKIYNILDKRQKALGLMVLVMTLVNAVLQTAGVSIIVPIVSAMTAPDELMKKKWAQTVCAIFSLHDEKELFVFLCIVTIFLYIFKNAFCIFHNWVRTKYSNKLQKDISADILEGYMDRDYDFFVSYGSPQIIRDVRSDPVTFSGMISNLFAIITEVLTILLITVYIFLTDWMMAMVLVVLSAICFVLITNYFKNKMRSAGETARAWGAQTQKAITEASEGIKEIKVMRKQQYFLYKFKSTQQAELVPEVVKTVGTTAPTYIIEAIFVTGILVFLCIRALTDPSYAAQMPVLASFVVGAVRMLPSLGRISSSTNGVVYSIPALYSIDHNISVLREQRAKKAAYSDSALRSRKAGSAFGESLAADPLDECDFQSDLTLKGVTWHYPNSEHNVLDQLNLSVQAGTSIGIIGQSGAGKSTLVDIILGLHQPQHGTVELDGHDIFRIPDAYSQIVGYVSQSFYLVDGTIRENVAFGEDESDADDRKVWAALEQAQLSDYVNQLEEKLDTVVGERGVRFSGGQRQRIAIARALYRHPKLLILDEATSALDNETESAVMEAIENLYGKMTMIIVAHRLSTVEKCDKIYEIKDGIAIERNKSDLFRQ